MWEWEYRRQHKKEQEVEANMSQEPGKDEWEA